MVTSPFRPGFGATPPLLAGRDDLLEEFADGLESAPGSSARVTFYPGARGIGKTVMLNAVEDLARERGWMVISETCAPGVVERLVTQHLPPLIEEIGDGQPRRRLAGVSIPVVGGIAWENLQRGNAPDLRTLVTSLTDLLAPHGTGLLITLDEIHPANAGELAEIAVVIQHAIREDRNVAFAGSALQASVEPLMSGDTTTFLRRAVWHELGRLTAGAAEDAIRLPISEGGRSITDEALAAAAAFTEGYSFMVQLVGDLLWRRRPAAPQIDATDLQAIKPSAVRRMGTSVIAPELRGLTDIERSYLLAMARQEPPASTMEVASLLHVDKQYQQTYRTRLIEKGVIQPVRRGFVDFTTPGMRQYVLDHYSGPMPPGIAQGG